MLVFGFEWHVRATELLSDVYGYVLIEYPLFLFDFLSVLLAFVVEEFFF